MRPMLHTDYEDRYDQVRVTDRRGSSWGTTIALVVIVLALVAAFALLVRAGTDGIDADPVVTTTLVDGIGG